MGTEIIGLIVFVFLAFVVSVVLGISIKNLPVAIAVSALLVVISVQSLNYLSIGQFQLMSAMELAFAGGVPAIITLIAGLLVKSKRTSI